MNMMDNLTNILKMEHYYGKKLDIALVGAGRAGYFHTHSLLKFSSFNLKYIVDMDLNKATNLQKIYGGDVEVRQNLEDILCLENISCIIIATSTQTHYDLTVKCLQAKKNVLVEKPLDNVSQCFKLAKDNDVKLLVGYHKRFDANYQEIIKKVKVSNLPIKNIKMTLKDNFIPPISYLQSSGGIVLDMLTHDIDIINLLMNFKLPSEVVAISSTQEKSLEEIDEIENIEVLMKYPDGELVTITSSRNAGYGYDHRMEIVQPDNLLVLKNDTDTLVSHYTSQAIEGSKVKYNFPERFKEAYLNEINYFYHMIVNGYPTLINAHSLEVNHKIADLINQSLLEKRIIKSKETELRNYEVGTPQYYFYLKQHQTQTLSFVEKKLQDYQNLNRMKMNLHRALEMLDDFVDPSDPDVDLPNSIHAYQTAERIRKQRPLQEQLQLTGLIHDLGKVLFKFGEESHVVVGDTYAVGCPFPTSIVYYETMKENADFQNPLLNEDLGIYQKGCGIENLKITFGHDEYLYLVLKNNKTHKLDKKYWDIIRFHSFYPWHTGKAYQEFMTEDDKKLLADVLDFNQFDLYSKEDIDFKLTDEIKEYYQKLIDKYFPEELNW